ncbi:MAG: DUF1015 family protein [candidate division KSB1 bacterium]
MAQLRPFFSLMPPAQLASRLSCPPYDVVNAAEARAFAAHNPQSFMRLIRAEVDLPETLSPYDEQVYQQAHRNLRAFENAGWLQRSSRAQLFVYRLRAGEHTQTGVAGCCAVAEYESGLICKHENTKPEKENDRTRHLLALAAHAEPVLLAYRGRHEIDANVAEIARQQPLYDFVAEDGVQHTLWPVEDSAPLMQAFMHVPRLYIADGHHRSASAWRARAELLQTSFAADAAYNFFPAALFPAEQLRILAYNRLLRDLPNWNAEQFLARLRRDFEYREAAPAQPARKGEVSVYLAGQWHGFTLLTAVATDPLSQLDLTRLQQQLLEPYFGIVDQRTDKRIDFVGGMRGTQALQRAVDQREAQIALSLFPPSLDELFAVSDRGELMPPKSTWFEPKLRSGLFMQPL